MLALRQQILADISFCVAEPPSANDDTETILCLHGIGGDDKSFLPQLAGLSDTYRVISWNMPGYGQSAQLTALTFESLANSFAALINELKHNGLTRGPVHIMGQSIGGMIAQEVAISHPSLVKSLLLIATTSAFGGKDENFKTQFLADRLKPLDDGVSMPELARLAVPNIVGPETPADIIEAAVESMSLVKNEVYRDVLACLITFNRRDSIASIQCPVCLIAGSNDSNAPAATMQKMESKFKTAEYNEVERAGHLVNLEKGSEVNKITKRFLQSYF